MTNPLTGTQVPAMVLLMMGLMMAGVFFICDNIFRWLRQGPVELPRRPIC